MTPDLAQLYDVIDGTWPAAETRRQGHMLLRRGEGGGQRVSAATALGHVTPQDVDAAVDFLALFHQGFHLRAVAHVARHPGSFQAVCFEFRSYCIDGFLAAAADDDAGALLGQPAGNGFADAAR